MKREFTAVLFFFFSTNMEDICRNYSIDPCNAFMMNLVEKEKHNMETKRIYLPISQYNIIMLMIENEKQINLDTLCNYFPFYALNASMILIEKENHIIMETTCKKFSISLFNAMMILMGKEKHINMRRTEIDVYDKLYNEACSKHIRRVNTGSRKEGFRINFSDLDCFYFSTRHRVVWSLTDMHSYDPVTESVILVEYHPSIPGTVYLRLKESCSKNTDLINKIKVVEKNSRRNMYIRHFGILQMKDPQSYNRVLILLMAIHVGNGLCKHMISWRDVGNLDGLRKILLKTWCRLCVSLHRLAADSHAMTMTLTVI